MMIYLSNEVAMNNWPTHSLSPGSALAPVHTDSKRALVVDDEEGLCELACAWLSSLGYESVGVHSSSAALEQLERQAFDLLFTDVVMPGGMDGLALAKVCNQRWPAMRILITSGDARGISQLQDLPGALLNKPYRKHDIVQALKEGAS